MTEDQARQRWCPFAQSRAVKGNISETREAYGAYRGGVKEGISVLCIASDCMAFRWTQDNEYVLQNGLVAVTDTIDNFPEEHIWWDGRYVKVNADGDEIRLHRLLAERAFGEIPKGMYVDHIDGDILNNRRGNLRIVTPQQSGANQKSRGGASQYRGVSKGRGDKWFAQIASGGIRWHIGTFDTEEQAAAAYDEKAKEVHGEFARLNLEPKTNSGRQGYCGLAGKP